MLSFLLEFVIHFIYFIIGFGTEKYHGNVYLCIFFNDYLP